LHYTEQLGTSRNSIKQASFSGYYILVEKRTMCRRST
jgi:hypothetical protein